jgi:hypothetical protein
VTPAGRGPTPRRRSSEGDSGAAVWWACGTPSASAPPQFHDSRSSCRLNGFPNPLRGLGARPGGPSARHRSTFLPAEWLPQSAPRLGGPGPAVQARDIGPPSCRLKPAVQARDIGPHSCRLKPGGSSARHRSTFLPAEALRFTDNSYGCFVAGRRTRRSAGVPSNARAPAGAYASRAARAWHDHRGFVTGVRLADARRHDGPALPRDRQLWVDLRAEA